MAYLENNEANQEKINITLEKIEDYFSNDEE